MKTVVLFSTVICVFCLLDITVRSWDGDKPLITDHTQTDLSLIPDYRIESVKLNIKLHYAHTSHGGQLVCGLSRLSNSLFSYELLLGALPNVPGKLCVFDGQEGDSYVTPGEYWETVTGMNKTRSVLNNNPSINVSMWAWCTQLNYYTVEQVQAYLDSISQLEAELPNVTFVYMTCNAQETGSVGYKRYTNNEMIRQYCIDNNRVLYDFADLDSWWYNPSTEEWEQATYEYESHTVPVEHPQFNGDEVAHTTYESCEQKGRALWWLLTRIEGGAAGDTLAVYEQSWGRIKNLYK